jgi:hypothetical protein
MTDVPRGAGQLHSSSAGGNAPHAGMGVAVVLPTALLEVP